MRRTAAALRAALGLPQAASSQRGPLAPAGRASRHNNTPLLPCTLAPPRPSLQAGLATAQRHVTIASLYFGTGGGREQQFVDALAAAAHDASRPHLRLHLLLDALRSTRPTKGVAAAPVTGTGGGSRTEGSGGGGGGASGAAAATTSTAEMLAVRLLEGQQLRQQQQHGGPASKPGSSVGGSRDSSASGGSGAPPPRVSVSLFHTPALRGLLKRWVGGPVPIVGSQACMSRCFTPTNHLARIPIRHVASAPCPQVHLIATQPWFTAQAATSRR